MLKKNCFILILLCCVLAAISSQEDNIRLLNRIDELLNRAEDRLPPATGSTAAASYVGFSFSLQNDIGYEIREIYIRRVDAAHWGTNVLEQPPLHHRRRTTIRLDQSFDPEARYSIRIIDSDKTSWIKFNLAIEEGSTIELKRTGFFDTIE